LGINGREEKQTKEKRVNRREQKGNEKRGRPQVTTRGPLYQDEELAAGQRESRRNSADQLFKMSLVLYQKERD